MIKKIVLSVFVAFVMTFTIFFLFQLTLQNEIYSIQKDFYSQNFEHQSKKIFSIGSSHVGQINASHVGQILLLHKKC